MYAVYCAVSLATLPICVMLGVAALSTTLAVRFFSVENKMPIFKRRNRIF